MKKINHLISLAGLTTGLLAFAANAQDQTPQPPGPGDQTAPPAAAPANPPAVVPATPAPSNPPAVAPVAPAASAPAAVAPAPAPVAPSNLRMTTGPAAAPATVSSTNVPQAADEGTNAAEFPAGEGLVFKFRGVPLEQVLNYLSKAAGFIIHPEVSINGNVDAYSDQPLSKEEALQLVEHVLSDNGYAVIRDGRILTIISAVEAKRKEIPVIKFTSLDDIPHNSEVATYIIPVRTLNPVALLNNLRPLIGSDTDLQANESANSLLITDSQNNIRRIAKIVMELDSVSSSINTIEVFPLKYADAKSLADLVKELFPNANTANGQGGNNIGGFGRGGRGGFGGFGGFGGGGGFGVPGGFGGPGGAGGAQGQGSTPQSRVAATSDDHSNSLIVSAPEDLLPIIRELVEKLDQPIEDVTEVKMFHLKNADCTEMANLLTSVFPDPNSASDAGSSRIQFGGNRGRFGGFGAFFGAGQQTANSESQYMKKMGNVLAVPDPRTQTLLVSASKDLMPQIEDMITELDEVNAGAQHVVRIPLENADPQDVLQIIQDIYPMANNGRSTTTSDNPLLQRSQTVQQNMNSTGIGSGNTSSMTGSGGRGATGFQ